MTTAINLATGETARSEYMPAKAVAHLDGYVHPLEFTASGYVVCGEWAAKSAPVVDINQLNLWGNQ